MSYLICKVIRKPISPRMYFVFYHSLANIMKFVQVFATQSYKIHAQAGDTNQQPHVILLKRKHSGSGRRNISRIRRSGSKFLENKHDVNCEYCMKRKNRFHERSSLCNLFKTGRFEVVIGNGKTLIMHSLVATLEQL